jgi:hypothetical protein
MAGACAPSPNTTTVLHSAFIDVTDCGCVCSVRIDTPTEATSAGDECIVNEGLKWKLPPAWHVIHIVGSAQLELGWRIEIALFSCLTLDQLRDFIARRGGGSEGDGSGTLQA